MADKGWLTPVAKGIYLVRGDTLTKSGIIGFMAARVPGLHIGGQTALNILARGERLDSQEIIELWGSGRYEMPDWVKRELALTYQSTTLFSPDFVYSSGLQALADDNGGALISSPERALLEYSSAIGKARAGGVIAVEEALALGRELKHLKPETLANLLQFCTRVKVALLVRNIGQASGYGWGTNLQQHVDRLSAGGRWSNHSKNGLRLNLRS
jgi:hypothetical protein